MLCHCLSIGLRTRCKSLESPAMSPTTLYPPVGLGRETKFVTFTAGPNSSMRKSNTAVAEIASSDALASTLGCQASGPIAFFQQKDLAASRTSPIDGNVHSPTTTTTHPSTTVGRMRL